jgi:hypothetical protein
MLTADKESRRAAEFFKQQTFQSLDAFAEWSPRVLYLSVVVFTGWCIIMTVSNFGSIDSTLNMQ